MTASEESGADGNSAAENLPVQVVPEPVTGASSARRPAAKVVHLTPAERYAHGKAARADVPRSVHAEWEPSSRRLDPVDLLEEQAQTRVPELVPIRYGRMLTSPFAFYRG